MTDLNQSTPRSIDAEKAVLGSILLSPKSLSVVAPIVSSADFATRAHQTLFEALTIMGESGFDTIDLVQLGDFLKGRLDERGVSEFEAIGGNRFLYGLMDPVPNIAGVERTAEIVAEKSRLRSLIYACNQATRQAMEQANSIEIVGELQATLAGFGVAEERASRPMVEIVRRVVDAEDTKARNGQLAGIRTDLQCINDAMLGIQRGALTVICAPPSHGKTALGLQVVEGAVQVDPVIRGAIYEAEMSDQSIAKRLIARNCRVSLQRLREWKGLDRFEREAINRYVDKYLPAMRERLSGTTSITNMADLVADIRRRKATSGLDIVLVDYLQIIDSANEETRERQVSKIAWQLSELAKTLDIGVVTLAQVTRTPGARLGAESARESKAIGQHARNMLVLERERQTNQADTSKPKCTAQLQIVKQSEGDIGDFILHFDGRYQSFSDGGCPTGCPFASEVTR